MTFAEADSDPKVQAIRQSERLWKLSEQNGRPANVFLRNPAITHSPMKELKESDYFKAWLLFFLIATVAGGAFGLGVGTSVGAVLSERGIPLRALALILQLLGLVIAMPISYLTFRAVVGKYLFPKLAEKNNSLPAS